LDKRNPVNRAFKTRFVVLTHENVHWFVKTSDSNDLFGEERGQIPLTQILSVRVLDEDSTTFEIIDTHTSHKPNNTKRTFRAQTPSQCEEWVSAIRSAIKNISYAHTTSKPKHKAYHTGASTPKLADAAHTHADTEEDGDGDGSEVYVSLVSIQTRTSEIVLARNPNWDRLINVPNVRPDDQVR
jgi:hypothetical protein